MAREKVVVDIEANVNDLLEKLNIAKRKLASWQNELKDADIKLNANSSVKDLQKALENASTKATADLNRKLSNVAKDIKIGVDTKQAQKDIKELERAMNRLKAQSLAIKNSPVKIMTPKLGANLSYGNNRISDARLLLTKANKNGLDVDSARKAVKNYENAVIGASRDIPNMLSYQTRAGILSNAIKDSFTLQKEAGLTPNLDKLKQQLAQIKVLESEMYVGLSDNKNAKKALTQSIGLLQELGDKANNVHVNGFGNGLDAANAKMQQLKSKNQAIIDKINEPEIALAEQIKTSNNIGKANNALDKLEGKESAQKERQMDDMFKRAKQEEIDAIRQAERAERERARTVSALTALENEEKRKMLAEQRAAVKAELQREKNAQYGTRIANDTKAAEKAWREGDFSSYNKYSGDRDKALAEQSAFLNSLNSITQQQAVYRNLLSQIKNGTITKDDPLYDTAAQLKNEIDRRRTEFTNYAKGLTGDSGAGNSSNGFDRLTSSINNNKKAVENDNKQFNELRKQLAASIQEINKFDSAAGKNNQVLNAKLEDSLAIMDKMKQFLTERGKLSYAAESKLYGDFLPSIQNEYARREWLKRQRVAAVNNNYANLGSSSRATLSGDREPTMSAVKNILEARASGIELAKLAGSFERGFGSGMHELARQAEMSEKSIMGINSKLIAIPEAISTGVAAVAGFTVAIGGAIGVVETLFGAVQSIGSAIEDYILKPGLEAANAMQMMRNGIAGAMSSIGLLNNQPLQFGEALNMADGIVKQLAVDAIKTGTSLEAITNTFRAIIEPGLQSGMNISQIEEMANLFTTIGKELQLNSLTIARDTRDIFNGMANRTVMAKQLGITDQEIQEVKAKGEDLYAWLEERLAGFVASNRENIATLGGAFDSLKSTWELSLASVFDNDAVKQPIIDFMKWIGSQIATVYDMGINPNSGKWEALKKSSAARNGIDTSDQAAVDQNAEDTGLQDDATKYRDVTGATEEETQALEEQNATVITLSDSFEGLINFVANFVEIIGDAVIEIAEYAEQSLGAGDSVDTLSDAISICVDLLVFIAERIIDVIALIEENKTSIEDLGYDALYAFAIIKNVLIGIVSYVKPVIAIFRALYNIVKATWDLMHGDAEGAAKAFTQAGVDAAEAAKDAIKKYIPVAGIAITGADILTNSYRDIKTIEGWRERSQQAREAGENSQPHKNLHGFTDGIRDFLNNRQHILSTQNPNQNALKGRPADTSKEQAKAQREAAKAQRAAIQESQKMLKEHREALKEVLEDKLDTLKDLLEKNDIAYKEGFKSIKDYYTEKAELEKEEASARLEEAKEELAAIQTSQFANEYDKLKEEHKVQREINKYTKELSKATITQKEISRDLGTYSEVMADATVQFSNMLSSIPSQNGVANGAQANTGDKVLDLAIEVAKQINAQTGQSPDIGILAGLIANETDNGNSPVFRDDNNIAGVTWNENYPEYMRGDARPPSEGGYYVKFLDLSAAAKDLAEVLEQDRYDGFLSSNSPSEAFNILHNGGYMTTSNLSGYIASAQQYQQKISQSGITLANYISSSIGNQRLGQEIGINAGNAITSALNLALNSGLRNAEMPDLANGCVEAVVRLGSWFNTFLADEYSKGVANVDRLVSDAKMQGIQVDNNTGIVQSGDVLVTNGGNHVVMVKDAQHTVGNSSHNNPNTSSGSGIMEQDLNYWLARTNAVIRTGSQGVALSSGASNGRMSLFSPHSSKEAMQAYEDMQKKLDEYKDILSDINGEIFGSNPMIEVKLRSLYEKLEKAKRDNSPDGKAAVEALNIRIRQETAKVVTDALEKQLEFNINRLETTAKYRAYEVAYGKNRNYDTDFGELAQKYMNYINKPANLNIIKEELENKQKIYDFLSNPEGFKQLSTAYKKLTSQMETYQAQTNAKDLVSQFNSLSAEYNKYKAQMESIGWDKTNPKYRAINEKERPANDALWQFNNTKNNREVVDTWSSMSKQRDEMKKYFYGLSTEDELKKQYKTLNDDNYTKNQEIANKLSVLNELHNDTQNLLKLRGNDMMSESYKTYYAQWKEANDKEWAYRNNENNKKQFDSYEWRTALQNELREGLKSSDIGKYANIRNTQNAKFNYDKALKDFNKENQKFYEMQIKYTQGYDMSDTTKGMNITRQDLLAEQKLWNQKKSELSIKEQAYYVAKEKSDVELAEYNKELDTLRTKLNLAKQTPAYQMDALVKQYAEFTAMGNVEKAEEIKKKLIDAQEKLYSMLNSMTQAISDRYDFMNSVLENVDLTNLQREEANKEMKAYKNAELSKAYKQQYTVMNNAYMDRQIEIAGLSDTLKKTQIERDRLPQDSKDRIALDKKIDELNADIALQMERQTASMQAMQEVANKERVTKMLSHMKTLLEETRITAKQALEDGLVTFLTDGVNEAKSLGEALRNLVVDFLKTMQQFFAKRLVYGLMQKWFPAKDENGQRMTTENLGKKVQIGQEYTLNQYRDTTSSGLIDYTTPSKSQIYIMKSEDGTGINGIQTYRDNSDILGLKNPETGHYFEMNNKPNNYNLMNTWMQDGQGGYFRVLDQNRTYSELNNSNAVLTSPTLNSMQSEQSTTLGSVITNQTGILGQKLDVIHNDLTQANTLDEKSDNLQKNLSNSIDSNINNVAKEAQVQTTVQEAMQSTQSAQTSVQYGIQSNTLQNTVATQANGIKHDITNQKLDVVTNNQQMEIAYQAVHNSESNMGGGSAGFIGGGGGLPFLGLGQQTGGFGSMLGGMVDSIAAPITGIASSVLNNVASFLNNKTFTKLFSSTMSVFGSAGAQLAGTGFAVKSFIKGDTKEKLLSMLYIEEQLLYVVVSQISGYCVSILSAIESLDTTRVTAATGGYISGEGTSTSDSIPAMLSNGEFVVKASAVRKYGTGFLNAVNNGNFSKLHMPIARFADGGSVMKNISDSTSRGVESFANNIGTNISNTNNISIGLIRDDDAIIANFLHSSRGQKYLLDFNRKNAKVINTF